MATRSTPSLYARQEMRRRRVPLRSYLGEDGPVVYTSQGTIVEGRMAEPDALPTGGRRPSLSDLDGDQTGE